jgi:hypothetical protein
MTRAGTQQPVTALAHGQRPGHLPRLRLTPSGAPATAAGQPTPRPRDAWSRTRWWRRCEVTAKLTAKPHDNRQRASAVPAGRVGLVLSSPLIAGALRERQQQVGPISWPAPGRPSCDCAALRQLERPKHITDVAVVAAARELAGILWAEMQL